MDSQYLAYRIRKNALEMVSHAHASHIGGILSCADIVSVMYCDVVKLNPHDLRNELRDRVVLSKGHNGVAVYIALAELGFFDKTLLATYGDNGSIFSCHVSHKKVPGVELTTGSLGHGICVACGMALNGKLRHKNYRVFAIVGDGECNEGSVWETVMLAAQYKLDNFTVIVDVNGMQAMGNTTEIINMCSLSDKWNAFGWSVIEVDGHNHEQLRTAFLADNEGKPKVILAKTVKGKGVSYMENELLWHYRDPQGEQLKIALDEVEKTYNA